MLFLKMFKHLLSLNNRDSPDKVRGRSGVLCHHTLEGDGAALRDLDEIRGQDLRPSPRVLGVSEVGAEREGGNEVVTLHGAGLPRDKADEDRLDQSQVSIMD